jgi:hypothetical protein
MRDRPITIFPGIPVGSALGVAVRHLRAFDKILRIPFGRRQVRITGELIEVGQKARRDPARGEDEGDIDEVEGRAAGG